MPIVLTKVSDTEILEGLSEEVAELKLMYFICKQLAAVIKYDILSQCTYFEQENPT